MQHLFFKRLLVALCIISLLLVSLITFPSVAFAASSTASVSPNQGPAGTQVIGSGSNWAAGDQMQISWGDNGSILANTTVQSTGTFSVGFMIPTSAGIGAHNIYFTDLTAHYFLVPVFTVTAGSMNLTVQKAWTGDNNNTTKTSFAPGDVIHYLAQVSNANSTALTATFSFLATGPQQIYSWSGTISFPSGISSYYSPSTVPTNALAGTYTLTVTITYNGMSSQGQGVFTVKSPTPTIDLQTTNIQSLQPVFASSSPTFRAYIRNNGSAASGNFNIRWIADGKIADGGHYSIPPGVTDTHDYIWSNIAPGQHTLTFIANFDHSIPESNYNNNQFTLTFTVPTPSYNEVKDGNWSGYSIKFSSTKPSDTMSVSGAWTVPSVSCTSNGKPISGQVAAWVGLGGSDQGNDLEQIGTDSQCVNGVAKYWAWYEFPPANPYPLMKDGNYPINSGDAMHADVTDQGYGYFVLRISDDTKGWHYIKIMINQNASAIPHTGEWIVEDPGNATFPQFYNVLFTNCYWAGAVNQHNALIAGASLTRYTIWTLVIIVGNPVLIKPIKATTLDVFPDNTDFSTYWNHA